MPNRYGDDIRRIAGTDIKRDDLDPSGNRASIPGQRGIGYGSSQNPRATSGTPGQSTAPASTNPNVIPSSEALAADNEANKAGQTNNPNDPSGGGNIRSENDGVQTAEELFDQSQDSNFNGILDSSVGGVLNGITGLTDCESGKPMNVRFDGLYIPPDDPSWIEALEPPVDTTWESGKQIQDSADSTLFASPQAWFNNYAPGGVYFSNPAITDCSLVELTPGVLWSIDSVIAGGTVRGTGGVVNCTPGSSDSCPATAPILDKWPPTSDQSFQLTAINGSFIPSIYDANAPASFSEGKSTINACFGNGRTMTIESNNMGGKTLYETNSEGAPIGVVRVYNSARELVAFTDSFGLRNYQPR